MGEVRITLRPNGVIVIERNDLFYAGDGDDEIRLLAGNDVGIGAANDNRAYAAAA